MVFLNFRTHKKYFLIENNIFNEYYIGFYAIKMIQHGTTMKKIIPKLYLPGNKLLNYQLF